MAAALATAEASLGRVRRVAAPICEAALAAALAWYVAHVLLGHPSPFFAPIAAAVALSTSHVQRARRSAQMVVGVLLGIGVAELLAPLIGDATASIGVVVLVTLTLAVAVGGGFFGEGMMFVNQAAASAILVIALHRAGTGSERAVDALVGGGVALVIGVGLFPADPLKLLWQAEDGVLRTAISILRHESRATRDAGDSEWEVSASHELARRLAALTQARTTARASVRVAPRRMRVRAAVDAEERRVARLYLLGGDAIALARAIGDAERQGTLDPSSSIEIDVLARAVEALLAAARPWTSLALAGPRRDVSALLAEPLRSRASSVAVSIAVRSFARDLLAVLPPA